MDIANQSGAGVRADLNLAIAALVSNSSGSTAPTTTFAYQFWVDTSGADPVLKMRNGANSAWLTLGFSGDVTSTGGFGNLTATIGSGIVTNAKLATIATQIFKGRTTAGTGAPEDLTVTQATAMLNAMVGDGGAGGTKGLVPAPGSGDAAALKYLKADGTWAAAFLTDGSTITHPAGVLGVPAGGIGTTQLAASAVTRAKTAAVGQQISSSCGSYTVITGGGSFTAVTNLSVSLTTTGRPVIVGLQGDRGGSSGGISVTGGNIDIQFYIDGSQIQFFNIAGNVDIPASSMHFIDTPAAGSHTYTVSARLNTTSATINNSTLYAYEL
jgi:hypothetical protein